MNSKYYDTRQQPDGLWYIVGSLDNAHWYYLYEREFSFFTEAEAHAWLRIEGYTAEAVGNWIAKAVIVKQIEQGNKKYLAYTKEQARRFVRDVPR